MTLASGSRGGPPGLDAHTRSLVRVAIAVATGDTAALKERLVAGRISELETQLYNKAAVVVQDRELGAQFERSRSTAQ